VWLSDGRRYSCGSARERSTKTNRIIGGTIIVVFSVLFVIGIAITCLTEAREDLARIITVSSIFTLALVGTGTLLIRFGLRAHRLQKALRTVRAEGDPSVDPEEIAKRFRLRPAFLKRAVSEEIRARKAVEMRTRGELRWSWSAACGMGFWAFRHGIWLRVAGVVWGQKLTWGLLLLFVLTEVLVVGREGSGGTVAVVLLIFLIASIIHRFVLFGLYGAAWLYILKGIHPNPS